MASEHFNTDELLRVLVFSDPLSNADQEDLTNYLTMAIQLRYPIKYKRVIVEIWASEGSLVLQDVIHETARLAEGMANRDIAPYDWVVPLFQLQKECPISARPPQHPCRTLLTTVPYFNDRNRAFLNKVNGHIVELAKADKRYLLDLRIIFRNLQPSNGPTPLEVCYICEHVARYIVYHQLIADGSEHALVRSIFASSDGDVNPFTVETDRPYTKEIIQRTRKEFIHGYTHAQKRELAKRITGRCVQPMANLQNIDTAQNSPKAKRTQTQGQNPKMRITRPDRVHAENYIVSPPKRRKYLKNRVEEEEKENCLSLNSTTHSSSGNFGENSSRQAPLSTLNVVPVTGGLDSRHSNTSTANYQNSDATSNKRTYQDAFHRPSQFMTGYTISPRPNSSTFMPNSHGPPSAGSSDDEEEFDSWPKPDLSHPVFNASYKPTGKSHKEKKKRGKIVVLRYPPKSGRDALALPSSYDVQHGGSFVSRGRRSMLGDGPHQHKGRATPTPMAQQNSIGLDFSDPPRAHTSSKRLPASNGGSTHHVVGADGRAYIDPLQRQITDAALNPLVSEAPYADQRLTGGLNNLQHVDAGYLPNPLDRIGLGNVPSWENIEPDFTVDDVMRTSEEDFRRGHSLTQTIDPRNDFLDQMTSDDIIEAHLPVLQGIRATYPNFFPPPMPSAVQNPLAASALHLNGDAGGMRRQSVPNPLNLTAAHPSQFQTPYQTPAVGLGISTGQAQAPSPTPAPRSLAPALAPGSALLVPIGPSQSHLPSPVTAGFVLKMADDVRTLRGTPEPHNNSAHLPGTMRRTPPGTPGNLQTPAPSAGPSQGVWVPQSSPQHAARADVRHEWRKEVDRNVRLGKCSFCGMEKDDPKCKHVITNRAEPETEYERNVRLGKCAFCGMEKDDPRCQHGVTNRAEPEPEIPIPELPVAEKQANAQAWLSGANAQAAEQDNQPDSPTQLPQMHVAQMQDVLPRESAMAPAVHAPTAESNIGLRTATPEAGVASAPAKQAAELSNQGKGMSSMQTTTERGGYLHQTYDAEMMGALRLKSQARAQGQAHILLGPQNDDVPTAVLSEKARGKRPMQKEGQKRKTCSDKGGSHAKPQKKTPSSFDKAKMACSMLSGPMAPRAPNAMEVFTKEAQKASAVPAYSGAMNVPAMASTSLPGPRSQSPFPFAVPQTPSMFAVPQNPMLAAMEGAHVSKSRPQTPVSSSAPVTPASEANFQRLRWHEGLQYPQAPGQAGSSTRNGEMKWKTGHS